MLRGEFHKSLPLLLTGQQLSVLRSLVYYSSSTHFLFETGIRLTRYGRFVNEILTMHRVKIQCITHEQQSGLIRFYVFLLSAADIIRLPACLKADDPSSTQPRQYLLQEYYMSGQKPGTSQASGKAAEVQWTVRIQR